MDIKQQDTINVIISLINIPLSVYEWIISWYISLGISLLTLYSDYQRGSLLFCVTRCCFIMNTCYGLYKWTVGGRQSKNQLQITKMSPEAWRKVLGWAGIGWGLFYLSVIWLIPAQWRTKIKNPALHTLIGTMVFTGQQLIAHKKLEAQLLWFVYNIIMMYNRAVIEGSILWLKHLIYLPLCFWGYTVWLKKYKKAQHKQDD
ncbi:MAG: nicotinamide mononucleotide transporter [Bacteroidota bacterium]